MKQKRCAAVPLFEAGYTKPRKTRTPYVYDAARAVYDAVSGLDGYTCQMLRDYGCATVRIWQNSRNGDGPVASVEVYRSFVGDAYNGSEGTVMARYRVNGKCPRLRPVIRAGLFG